MSYLFEIIVILVLIAINAYFALSEFAIISAKKPRLQQRLDEGDERAGEALRLADDPTPFLSTIQIGITLVGIFAGAYGGATLAAGLSPLIQEIPILAPYSDLISITLIVLLITYLTLVFGELIPKRIALSNAESIASRVARPMSILSSIASPFVFLLSRSTELFLRIFGIRQSDAPPVTEDEIKIMLEEGTEHGVFDKAEVSMVEGIFDLGDRNVASLMTPRPDIIGIDLEDSPEISYRVMAEAGHSFFPVFQGDLDAISGLVSVKDIWSSLASGRKPDIGKILRKPYFVPENTSILKLLETFRESGLPIALVTDEYGSIRGLVTLHDILESIVGGVRRIDRPEPPSIVQREDGSWLIDGGVVMEDLDEILPVDEMPGKGSYQTLSGFIMYALQRIPSTGDYTESNKFRFEVVDMDGNRVDKVLVSPTGKEAED
ncbi:MAG: hemolysin family protein [Methanoregulaceae archaeon]|jgi:putative hemolysin|nr:hemolysin family protein [Methanoregulaceae archaeon]MCU0628060.1 hemolysin family protein [Methanoregulaceae archaeon]